MPNLKKSKDQAMKDPVKILIETIVFAIVFLAIYTSTMYFIEKRHYEDLIVMHNHAQAESLRGILDQYEKAETAVGKAFTDDLNADVHLKALALSANVVNGQYSGTRLWKNAMAVRITNSGLDIPPDAAGMFPGLTSDVVRMEYLQTRFKKESGEEVLLTSGRIADDWYYVSWVPVSELNNYVKSYVDIRNLLEEMTAYYQGEILLVSSDEGPVNREKGTILYGTSGVKAYGTISELGISEEDLGEEYFKLNTGDDNSYICTPMAMESGQILICGVSVNKEKTAFMGDILTQVLFATALFAVLIVWCYSVLQLMNSEKLNRELHLKYSPKAVKRKTMHLCRLSVLLVFVVAFLTVVMQYTYQEDKAGNAVLSILEKQLEEDIRSASDTDKCHSGKYEAFGRDISQLLTVHPDYLAKDRLSELSRIIKADYLIVFDENGNEIGCSEDYTGFSLGTAANDPSADFRRLLKGVPSVTHETEKDFITGKDCRTVGVRYDLPDKQNQYGAILISLPALSAKAGTDKADVKERVYTAISSEDEMILEIDPVTQMVVSGSREEYVGDSAAGLGIKKESLLDRQLNFFRIDRKWYFGISRLIEGNIYYYLSNNTFMLVVGTLFALLTSVIFLIGYWLTAGFALRTFTKEAHDKLAQVVSELPITPNDFPELNTTFNTYVQRWNRMLPEQRSGWVMQVATGLFMAALLFIAVSNTPLSNHSLLSFVIEGNWTKGINVFGIVAVIMAWSIEYLAYIVVRILFLFLYGVLDAKGETVARLFRSLINYMLAAAAFCLSLNYLGVDTSAILASLGLLSLAVSLGAKDIVADILSGISIVFERQFAVGDFVEIGGFRGRVLELGIRSTKLLGAANDIKTINNSNISGVLNLSKRTSFCSVTFAVGAARSLEELKEMLARELPAYKEKIPGIISGPAYDGIESVAEGKMTIRIIAEAREEDLPAVKEGLNQILQSLYERKLLHSEKKITNVLVEYSDK